MLGKIKEKHYAKATPYEIIVLSNTQHIINSDVKHTYSECSN